VRLTGLLAHALYWTCLGHLWEPERRLPTTAAQSLVISVQALWAQLVDPIRRSTGRRGEILAKDSPSGICFVLAVFLVAIKRGVEHIFYEQYGHFLQEKTCGPRLTQQLLTQLNIMVMNVFDPDCAFAHFGALDSSVMAIRLWKRLALVQMKLGMTPAAKMHSCEFRSSPATLWLMHSDGGQPVNPKTRIHLQKSNSDSVLATTSGVHLYDSPDARTLKGRGAGLSPQRPWGLDAGRREVLHHVTRSRLAFSTGGKPIAVVESPMKQAARRAFEATSGSSQNATTPKTNTRCNSALGATTSQLFPSHNSSGTCRSVSASTRVATADWSSPPKSQSSRRGALAADSPLRYVPPIG